MADIGLIGAGDMGFEMAKNLLEAGHKLSVFDVREEPLKELEKLGATPATTPAEVGQRSSYAFVMVLSGEQAREATEGKDGLLEGLAAGSTIIYTATIGQPIMMEIAATAVARGVHVIDSPVSGSTPRAKTGTLTMMPSGQREIFEECLPILEVVGGDIIYVGSEPGMGQTAKTALQVLVGATFAGTCEALVLGVKAGLEAESLSQVLCPSIAGSLLVEIVTENVMKRNFTAGSKIATTYKDLGLANDLAKELGVPMFVTGAVHELFQAGIAMNPDEDNHTIIKLLEQVAGVEVKGR
jgi:3-hydroxyisobutyrate dehydrogenase-like beta-hydroxyacid dehydrogenase